MRQDDRREMLARRLDTVGETLGVGEMVLRVPQQGFFGTRDDRRDDVEGGRVGADLLDRQLGCGPRRGDGWSLEQTKRNGDRQRRELGDARGLHDTARW